MSDKTPVLASTPFLTLDQAAIELGAPPSALPRLVALGVLTAQRAVTDGQLRFTPAALQQFVAAGCPRAVYPLMTADQCGYEIHDLRIFAMQFEGEVRGKLAALFPPTCPVNGLKRGESQSVTLIGNQAATIMELVQQSASWWERFPGAQKSPFANRGQQFIAYQLLSRTLEQAAPTVAEAVKGMTTWAKLFHTAESYRGCVDRAWATMQTSFISMSKRYDVDLTMDGWATVHYQVPFSLFGGKLAELETLIF